MNNKPPQKIEPSHLFRLLFFIYNLLLFVSAIFAVPYFFLKMLLTGKYKNSLGPKFGFVSSQLFKGMSGSPRIWVHAVSVGEVTAASPVIAALRSCFPDACIILSTSTETGQDMARRLVPEATAVIYYPLDIPYVIRKMIENIKPDLFIATETELWPNFIRICREKNVKIVMINGRISRRSYKKYFMTRFFWRHILKAIDEIGVISEVDAVRMKSIGMPASRVCVMGNAKYDSLAAKASPELKEEISRKLNISDGEFLLVAGSTHDGEEKIILSVYKELLKNRPYFKLIMIPRHVERGPAVIEMVKEAGFDDVISMKDINEGKKRAGERIIVVDVIGELFKIYSLATVVFCGGSLVPRGGQNILEPAAWGKVIFFGPYMDDFLNERDILESSGAGITVKDEAELIEGILKAISDEKSLAHKGEAGRKVVIDNMGASQRYLEMIISHLKN